MFQELVKALAEKENVTEKIKAENTFLWIRKMNNIRNRASEFVNTEVIYVRENPNITYTFQQINTRKL